MAFLPKQRVVVPTDFADESVGAIQTALELVDDPSNVHVLHVMIPVQSMAPGVLWSDMINEPRDADSLDFLKKFLSKHGCEGVTPVIEEGDPGLTICDYAKEQNADMIVIPSHGYHGVKRMLLGSVAERVIRHANCAVLVLRREDAD